MREAWEPDYSDFVDMLVSIGGWTVGCENEVENATAVARARSEGLITTRIHKAPIDPKGWECWELTDAGIEFVRQARGDKQAGIASRLRQWYRDNAAKY